MGDTGFVRFPGSLDPRAEEFRPRNPYSQDQITLVQPQFFYPYPPTPYPPNEVQVFGGGGGYPQLKTPPAYARPSCANPPLPPPLPPPSTTPTRTLLLSSVPIDVSESEARRELEVFGDVRAVQMERVRDGIVTVHFYDLRNAQAALVEIRQQHMHQQSRLRKHFDALLAQNSVYELQNLVAPLPPPAPGLIAGHAVWAQFTIPATAALPDGHNQGTLVVFNLDSEVSTTNLKEIFDVFGPVKELRETPLKRHQRFVEFYDVRDAAKALAQMNGKEIHGTNIVIEFSRPGGHGKRFSRSTQNTAKNSNSPPNYSGRNSRCLPPSPPPPPSPSYPRGIPGFSAVDLPPSRCYNSQTRSIDKKSSFVKGNPNFQASMASLCGSGAVGNGIEERNSSSNNSNNNNNNRVHPAKKNSRKGQNTSSCGNQQQQQPKSSKINRPLKGRSTQAKGFDPRFLINEDGIVESNCRDSRTTVMIKNIPNKYSQKLLLNMLDNHCIHCNEQIADGDNQPLSSYDFVYLPIDFINKCNVGYGFVNMTSPQATWRLYKAFHLQNWEVFNSKKICEVTYARLQGVEALKDHFKNSKFPCEAEEYLPVVFSPPRDGRQLTEPIPIVGRTNASLYQSPPPAVTSKNSETDQDEDDERISGGGVEVHGNNVLHIDGGGRGGNNDEDWCGGGGGSRRCSSPQNGGDNNGEDSEREDDMDQ